LTDTSGGAPNRIRPGKSPIMGIESRDYFRETSRYSGGGSGGVFGDITPVVKFLLIANIAVFLLQMFTTRPADVSDLQAFIEAHEEWFENVPDEELPTVQSLRRISIAEEWLQLETDKVIRQGQIWRLLTCAFCHDRFGLWHIGMNMLFLYLFGRTLERMYGSREFLLFYLTAAIVASLAYVGLDLVTGDQAPAYGASGAVMAVVMLYAVHFPYERILLFFMIPIEVRWLAIFFVVFDLHPVLLRLAGEEAYTGVAHAAHLGGLAFGFAYWKWNLQLERFVGGIRLPRWDRLVGSRRGIRLHRPRNKRERDDAEVDRILDKIHREGEDSLSDRERETLSRASEQYKNEQDDEPGKP
jgi:membrane associated rhomboid family serine protease